MLSENLCVFVMLWMDPDEIFRKCWWYAKEQLIEFWQCSWFQREFDLWHSKDLKPRGFGHKATHCIMLCNLVLLLPGVCTMGVVTVCEEITCLGVSSAVFFFCSFVQFYMGIKWISNSGSTYVTKWVTLIVVIYAGIYGAFNICNESLWDI